MNVAATREQIALPAVTDQGMGTLSWRDNLSGRLVSLKRRLVPLSEAGKNGVEWAFWTGDRDDNPLCVASFREGLHPTEARVAGILSLLKGWLIDTCSPDWVQAKVSQISAEQVDTPLPVSADNNEYWLSEDRRVAIIVLPGGWRICSKSGSLASWRSRNEEKYGDSFPLRSLDEFIFWLANNWNEIAHGMDQRPASLQHRGVPASSRTKTLNWTESALTSEVKGWWSRHAIRAADPELPNVFFERQADELVISWDANPSQERFYRIYTGEEVVSVAFALPVLRRLGADSPETIRTLRSRTIETIGNVVGGRGSWLRCALLTTH